jgi:hypothetical protein
MINYIYIVKFFINNFKKYKSTKKKSKILIELFDYKACIISNGIFADVLKTMNDAEIVGYEPKFLNLKEKIKNLVRKFNFFNYYNLYKSFGLSSFLIPKRNKKIINIKKKSEQLIKKIKTKKDVENFFLNGIYLGDILYDTYLREKLVSTIDVKSTAFKEFFFKFLELFYFWENYFSNNNVKALIISHSVYIIALAPRIAMSNNIDVFNVGFSSAYRLTKKKPMKFNYFEEYPKEFKMFPKKIRIEKIKLAKNYLQKRFLGKQDLLYNESKLLQNPVFLPNSKLKFETFTKKKI